MEKRSRFLGRIVLIALFALLLPLGHRGEAAGPGFGIMGDSSSDEFRADNNRGGAYAETTLNWMELLVRYRGLDFGVWGTRESPRRTGYEYNWALSGATSAGVISLGQHTGLAEQVRAGQVSSVILMIGANDFAIWNGTYEEIYDGSLSDEQVTDKVDSIISNISLALQTVLDAGADNVFVATLADRGSIETFRSRFPVDGGRQRVTNAIMSVNSGIKSLAAGNGVVVIDSYAFVSEEIFPLVDANGDLDIGDELISTLECGDEPHHMLLADSEHGGTVMNGVLANFVIDQMNTRNLGIAKFTDPELIANAGILPPPPDTKAPTVSLTAPYNGATVSGTSRTVSASASDNVGVIGVQFKLDGGNIGTEDKTSPYSISWNTTQTTNGQHVLTAVARDAAGNMTTSTGRTVNVNNPLPDTTPPQVSITSPADNASVSGTISLQASASDNKGVVGVQFKRNGVNLGSEDITSPYSVGWNTTTVINGPYVLTAIARDAAGNTRTSNPINVAVNNPLPDTIPPQVSITSPASNDLVSGTISVQASASDNVGIAGVQFRLDGNNLGTEDTTFPYSVSWNTTAVTNGPHTLTAVARDAAGNTSTAANVSVTINNPTPQTYVPQSYAVSLGSYQSGNLTSLTSDDNNFLVTKSTSSGWYRESITDFEFRNVSIPVSRLDYSVRLKSSASSTSVTIYAYSFVTASWTQLNSSSIGASEVTKNVSITSSASSYVNAEGKSLIRLKSSKLLGSHSISSDLVSLMATP